MKAMAEINRFWQCESGAVAAEYGLLIAFISLAIVGGVATFGATVKNRIYDDILTKFPS